MKLEEIQEIEVLDDETEEKINSLKQYAVIYKPSLAEQIYYVFATDENDARKRCYEDHHHYEEVYDHDEWQPEVKETGEELADHITEETWDERNGVTKIKWNFSNHWKKE